MDVLPAHLNRDSFRDSFKGLVALEIVLDLPFGFPINNIISLLTQIHTWNSAHQKKGDRDSKALKMARRKQDKKHEEDI